jgi:hypothetical protein
MLRVGFLWGGMKGVPSESEAVANRLTARRRRTIE